MVEQRVYLGSKEIPAKVALQLTWEQIGGVGCQADGALRGVALLNRLIERENREQLLLATTPGRRHVILQHACKTRGCTNTELCVAAMKACESHGLMTLTDSEDSVPSSEICHVACFSPTRLFLASLFLWKVERWRRPQTHETLWLLTVFILDWGQTELNLEHSVSSDLQSHRLPFYFNVFSHIYPLPPAPLSSGHVQKSGYLDQNERKYHSNCSFKTFFLIIISKC